MTDVLVERHAEEPLSDAEIARMAEAGGACREAHRVRWKGTLLSADARDLICHFAAADLESVRWVVKAQGTLRARIWSCTLRDQPDLTADELAQSNVYVSWQFDEPIAAEELESIEENGAVCLSSHRVRFLRTFVSNDRRRVVCLCRAADAESVRLALREAKPAVERVWPFRHIIP
jgi:uncharacterized protein DUF4242